MGADPLTLGAIAVVAGAATNAGMSYYQGKKQEDAANAASARAAQQANTAAAVSASENAAAPTENKQAAQQAVDTSAQRRASISKTINRYAANGLRKTLG